MRSRGVRRYGASTHKRERLVEVFETDASAIVSTALDETSCSKRESIELDDIEIDGVAAAGVDDGVAADGVTDPGRRDPQGAVGVTGEGVPDVLGELADCHRSPTGDHQPGEHRAAFRRPKLSAHTVRHDGDAGRVPAPAWLALPTRGHRNAGVPRCVTRV